MKNKLCVLFIFLLNVTYLKSEDLSSLFKQTIETKSTEYLSIRDEIFSSFSEKELENFLQNVIDDPNIDDYTKTHAHILMERLKNKKIIEDFETIPWRDEKAMSTIKKYLPAMGRRRGTKVGGALLSAEKCVLRDKLLDFAKKERLPYFFVERLIKEIGFQDSYYINTPGDGLEFRTGDESWLKYDEIVKREEEEFQDMIRTRRDIYLDCTYWLKPLFLIDKAHLIIPAIEYDLKTKKEADIVYLAYFDSRRSLPLILNAYSDTGKIRKSVIYIGGRGEKTVYDIIKMLSRKEDLPLLEKFYINCKWDDPNDAELLKEDCIDNLKSSADNDPYKAERKEFQEIFKKHVIKNFYTDYSIFDEILLEDKGLDKKSLEWAKLNQTHPFIGDYCNHMKPLPNSPDELQKLLDQIKSTEKIWGKMSIGEDIKYFVSTLPKKIEDCKKEIELGKKPNLRNLTTLSYALQHYAGKYGNSFPNNLLEVKGDYGRYPDEIFYFIPDLSKPRIRTKFLYRGGLKYEENGKDYVLAYPQAENGKRMVMLTSGDVIEVPEEEFIKEAEKQGFPLK